MIRTHASIAAIAACSIAVGCATPVPQSKISSSASAIKAAEGIGAADEPGAAEHLRLARNQRAQGLRLVDEGKNKEAGRVLSRAEADARVSYSLAGEAKTRNEAARMIEEIGAMRAKL